MGDDTLFPTTEVIDRWGFNPSCFKPDALSPGQEHELQLWREALRRVLERSCQLSKRCVILTNSVRPWVETCIRAFAPELEGFLRDDVGPHVVYARERLPVMGTKTSAGFRPAINQAAADADELREEYTRAKYKAMKEEAVAFYSRYPAQTWKNILSFGDMEYERDAVIDLGFRRVPPEAEKETLRVKAVSIPTAPALSEITFRLKLHFELLPAYVHHDGDLDLALEDAFDPCEEIGVALGIPALSKLSISQHAWGRGTSPTEERANDELFAVNSIVATKARINS